MDHLRHSDLFDVSDLSISLVGCGGIGAASALVLSKMGVDGLVLYDGDTVDEVNLPTQFHRLSDLGRSKADAVADLVAEFSDDTIVEAWPKRITGEDALHDRIVISAVDSIQARKDIWQAVKNGRVRWYLDARMAAEEFHLFRVDMKGDISWYDAMLAGEDDAHVPDLACTAKATIYCAAIAAGQIGMAVKAIATGEEFPRILIHNIRRTVLTAIQ